MFKFWTENYPVFRFVRNSAVSRPAVFKVIGVELFAPAPTTTASALPGLPTAWLGSSKAAGGAGAACSGRQ